jgi:hypothetical protein
MVFIDEGTRCGRAMRFADERVTRRRCRQSRSEYELGDARMMRRRGVMEW